MEGCRAALLGRAEQFVVALDARTRKVLALEVGLQRTALQEPACELHGAEQHPTINLFSKIVRVDDRRVERIGGARANRAAALRALLPGGDGHAGLALQLTLHALHVA